MSHEEQKSSTAVLALAALGVVYGDIGTSPLYALKEVFGNAHHPVPITPENVLGILSLVFWSLIVVVSFKYVALILRADNKGEGGIMALMARVLADEEITGRQRQAVILLGLFGAALFYGDGLITPAISVLSAVEGLEVATPLFAPMSCRSRWASWSPVLDPESWHGQGRRRLRADHLCLVRRARRNGPDADRESPRHPRGPAAAACAGLPGRRSGLGFLAMGSVFLVVTGAEALYADMGHFGRRPIRLAWFGLVLPALLLNYFGQGALLLADPATIRNPFYLMAPDWFLLPLVGLATAATVIASQAVITGVYSITQQAIQLGYAPRMALQHTSGSQIGQIYMPGVNWLMLLGVIALVLAFKSSTNLAAAYGIAVTGTMIITTLFAFLVARRQWGWRKRLALPVFGALLALDLTFLAANSTKIHRRRLVPAGVRRRGVSGADHLEAGTQAAAGEARHPGPPAREFIVGIETPDTITVPGTAVFMTPYPEHVPHALLHNLKHNKVLHEQVALATVTIESVPRVVDAQRVVVERLNPRFYHVGIHFGFMDAPDVPAALEWCAEQGLELDPMTTSYFLGRETVVPRVGSTPCLTGARPCLRTLYQQRRHRRGFLRPAAEPGGGAGDAGDAVVVIVAVSSAPTFGLGVAN
jgi:KUP system potassium uptake protein